MQPYIFPYIGYFQLINAVDVFVIYDDVQFIKGGWINRNHLLLKGDKFLFNLIINGASSNKRTIENSYKKAPFFESVFPLLVSIIMSYDKCLSMFIRNSIIEICNYINIGTEILISSELNKNNNLKGQDKVVAICKLLNSDEYINSIGGQKLYSKEFFLNNNIQLFYLQSNEINYQQFNGNFISNLSIIDVLMFNAPNTIHKMLNNYELI
jgi:hypothetical protein